MRTDTQPRDKFNISNDQFYEVSKDGGRHRVRQTFGQLVVEHAYPAQKLQLPFVRVGLLTDSRTSQLTARYSTRHAYQSRRLVPSIEPPYSSRRISRFTSAKSVQRRRRRTGRVARSARAATLARVCTVRAILAYGTPATSFCGSSLRSILPSFRTSVWAVFW